MKTFTAKLEGKDTKFEVDEILTLKKLKVILNQAVKITPGRSIDIDLIGATTGLIAATVTKPKQFASPEYVENLGLEESARIAEEVKKIVPLEKCLAALEPLLEGLGMTG